MTEFLDRPAGRVAYDDTGGDGPLLVAFPGMGDVRALYRFAVSALAAAGHRVVTMDIRGHGESSTGWDDHGPVAIGGDVLALLRALDGGPAVLVGSVACQVAARGGSSVDDRAAFRVADRPDTR